MASPIYRPLDPSKKEIRHLHLRPGIGAQDLAASLVHVELSDPKAAAYETISYAWGDASRRATLDIDGHILSVPQTAAAALRCMRLPDRDRVLWIDSICINQADIGERGSQVAMMADVYTRAVCTLAHVDVPECDFDLVVSSIAAVRSQCEHEPSSLRDLDPHAAVEGFGGTSPLSLGLGDTAVIALQQFLEAAWFRRLWVLQETTLSKRTILHCGSGTLELDHVFEFVEILFQDPMRLVADNSFSLLDEKIGTIFQASRMARRFHEHALSLQGLKSVSDFRDVTDDRDHVYALVGVYQKSNKLSKLPPDLIPDYTQDISSVYLRACQFAMTESQILDVWNTSRLFSPDPENWPSWAWRIRNGDDLEGTHFTYSKKSSGRILRGDRRACGSSKVLRYTRPVFYGERGQVLSIQGYPIALTTGITCVFDGLGDAVLSAFLSQVMDLFLPLQQSVGATLQLLGTTLVAAWNFTAREPGDADADDLLDLLRSVGTGSDVSSQLTPYLTSLRLACMHRRFFTTLADHMGLGPSQLEFGDVIVILAGCTWPVALRRCPGQRYRLLGACYIGELMSGDIADSLVEEGTRLMQFSII
ncbi:hypothetical protein LTR95_005454 [Oleoguttula sp. CCFEE 5521]